MRMLHVFTEEPSAKNVFEEILPSMLPHDVYYRIYPHQGKQDLERSLRGTLPTISKMEGSIVLITRDQDSADCRILKSELDALVKQHCYAPYAIRIICRELEAWFLGDLEAVKKAYPRFKPENYQSRAEFRHVDDIQNANEFLLSIIPEFKGRTYLPKLEVSARISRQLDLSKNRSISFGHMLTGIQKLINPAQNSGVQLLMGF